MKLQKKISEPDKIHSMAKNIYVKFNENYVLINFRKNTTHH